MVFAKQYYAKKLNFLCTPATYVLVSLVQTYKMTDWQIESNKLHFIRNRIEKETQWSPNISISKIRNTSVQIERSFGK